MLASMTAWICWGLPAVMLETVQHASLRMPSLGDERRERRAGRAPEARTTWVWRSSPVTMLPTERRAGVWTAVEWCLQGCEGRQRSKVPRRGILRSDRDIHQEVHETAHDARLDDGLDLVARAVGEVRDGPARVDEDLVV